MLRRNSQDAHLYEVIEHVEQPDHVRTWIAKHGRGTVVCTEEVGRQFLAALEAFSGSTRRRCARLAGGQDLHMCGWTSRWQA
jgi:hypothetical protein